MSSDRSVRTVVLTDEQREFILNSTDGHDIDFNFHGNFVSLSLDGEIERRQERGR